MWGCLRVEEGDATTFTLYPHTRGVGGIKRERERVRQRDGIEKKMREKLLLVRSDVLLTIHYTLLYIIPCLLFMLFIHTAGRLPKPSSQGHCVIACVFFPHI